MKMERESYRYENRPTYREPLEILSGRESRRKRRKEKRKKLK